MLFDLRGRGRRNTIKVIYITLAFLMGGGLVLFGIGGNTQRRPRRRDHRREPERRHRRRRATRRTVAAAQEAASRPTRTTRSPTTTLIRAQVAPRRHRRPLRREHQRVHRRPARPTCAGRRRRVEAVPGRSSPRPTTRRPASPPAMVQAFASLGDLDGAVTRPGDRRRGPRRRRAVLRRSPSYAYLAGQTRKGDLAAKKAIELEDADQRERSRASSSPPSSRPPEAPAAAPRRRPPRRRPSAKEAGRRRTTPARPSRTK